MLDFIDTLDSFVLNDLYYDMFRHFIFLMLYVSHLDLLLLHVDVNIDTSNVYVEWCCCVIPGHS